MAEGMFVTYWKCGICCGGAYIDTPDAQAGAGRMLLEAVRAGRKVGYIGSGDAHPVLVWKCPHPERFTKQGKPE
jgi:hypothetical protein